MSNLLSKNTNSFQFHPLKQAMLALLCRQPTRESMKFQLKLNTFLTAMWLVLLTSSPAGLHAALPICEYSSSDADGDGYGWENNASCIVQNSPAQSAETAVISGIPTCVSRSSDPDGDGFGWENSTSCKVRNSTQSINDENSRATFTAPTNNTDNSFNEMIYTLDDAGGSYSVGNGALTSEFDTVYSGSQSIKARYYGGGENGYARIQEQIYVSEGDVFEYGGAFYLPYGFSQQQQDQIALMRWDNYSIDPESADQGGLMLRTDGSLVLTLQTPGNGSDDLTSGIYLPEGQWVTIKVRQRMSRFDGNASNQLYINDELVTSSSLANSNGRDITKIRYGIVAVKAGVQTSDLTLYVDNLYSLWR